MWLVQDVGERGKGRVREGEAPVKMALQGWRVGHVR